MLAVRKSPRRFSKNQCVSFILQDLFIHRCEKGNKQLTNYPHQGGDANTRQDENKKEDMNTHRPDKKWLEMDLEYVSKYN